MQKKIVIVDDDYGIQDVARLIFEKAGYITVVLPTPDELYNGMHTDAHLIILDKQLAGFDGVEVCKELKSHPQYYDIPVLVMSATTGLNNILTNANADGYIDKPFTKKTLLQKIEQLLL